MNRISIYFEPTYQLRLTGANDRPILVCWSNEDDIIGLVMEKAIVGDISYREAGLITEGVRKEAWARYRSNG